MKKFSILLVSCALFLSAAFSVYADTASSSAQGLSQDVSYDLPYPGILPDSPFYVFKVIRDKIVSFLITDPQKQAEFDLLQADKRLAAGQTLLKEPNPNDILISQTVSKGENYFTDAIINISKAKREGRLVNDFLEKLNKSAAKHQEVLLQMSQGTKGQLRRDLEQDRQYVGDLQKQVINLKLHY